MILETGVAVPVPPSSNRINQLDEGKSGLRDVLNKPTQSKVSGRYSGRRWLRST